MTPTNERKVRTHRTTLYTKCSYLLASDTPTKRFASLKPRLSIPDFVQSCETKSGTESLGSRLVIGYAAAGSYLAGGGVKTASRFLTAHTLRLH